VAKVEIPTGPGVAVTALWVLESSPQRPQLSQTP